MPRPRASTSSTRCAPCVRCPLTCQGNGECSADRRAEPRAGPPTSRRTLYAPELRLVGSVSLAPTADVTGLAAAAAAQTLTPDQVSAYIWLLITLQRLHPDFDIDAYRHGLASQEWSMMSACTGADGARRVQVIDQLKGSDLQPSSPQAEQSVTDLLRGMALPQRRASAPMLVMCGGSDTYINQNWTRAAIDRACEMGSRIARGRLPGRPRSYRLDASPFSGGYSPVSTVSPRPPRVDRPVMSGPSATLCLTRKRPSACIATATRHLDHLMRVAAQGVG